MTLRTKVVLAVTAFAAIAALVESRSSTSFTTSESTAPAEDSTRAAPPSAPYVPYDVVESWEVGMIVVVEQKHRNESDLLALARQLQCGARSKTHWFVQIFDDTGGAQRHRESWQRDRIAARLYHWSVVYLSDNAAS